MSKNVTMSVSSHTGNTRKIAEGVRSQLQAQGWTITDYERGADVHDDVLVMCFWCWKSTFDPASMKLLERCEGKRILVLGTMGGYPDGPYAQKVTRNVTEAVSAHNECLGVFLSQGKVSMKSVEARKQLPVDDPHHLDDAGVERLIESQKHPDSQDVARAAAFVLQAMPAMEGQMLPA